MDGPAAWSEWKSFDEHSVSEAPTSPGVYMLREGLDGPIVYVGMAGDRRGQGLRGRLRVYTSGKGMVSGLGEAAMDRALADASWLRDRLAEVEAGRDERANALHEVDVETGTMARLPPTPVMEVGLAEGCQQRRRRDHDGT